MSERHAAAGTIQIQVAYGLTWGHGDIWYDLLPKTMPGSMILLQPWGWSEMGVSLLMSVAHVANKATQMPRV